MRASVKRFVLSPPARAPAAPSCRGHTGAPQACLGTPPRTALRRRLVPILHPGRPCAAGSSRSASRVESSAWAPALGSHCGLRGRLRHRRAARSEPIAHALQVVPRPTPPRPARACPPPPPLACPPRGAPPGLARPRPRRARLPTPAPRPRQIGSRGRRPCAAGSSPGGTWHEHRPPVRPTLIFGPSTHRWPPRMGLEANDLRSV